MYTSTKNIEVEKKADLVNYDPSDKRRAIINRVIERVTDMKVYRDQAKPEFDNRTLKQYIEDNVNAWNGIEAEAVKANKKNWQSLIFDHITRGKVKALVAITTGNAPYVNIAGQREEDRDAASELKDIFDFEWQTRNERYHNYMQGLDCAIKGTVIVEEFYKEERYKRKKVNSINHDTGKITFKEEEVIRDGYGHVESQIVPLLTFYPNKNYSEIKEDCAVIETLTQTAFEIKYGNYEDADKVTPTVANQESTYNRITDDIDKIEVIKYYNEDFDQYVILANGVWINPQDKDEVAPIPYNHKKLPFVKTVHETADIDCFYGKALPDLMTGERETINAILRLAIDKEILALNRPMLAGLSAELEDYDISPGAIVSTTGDVSQIREMDIREISQAPFSLLEFMSKRSNINTGIDPLAQGVASGGRKTLGEAELLDENAKRVAGSFQLFIFKLLRERAKLRISNIQQFYKEPIGKQVIDGKSKQKYRTVVIEKNGFAPVYKEIDPKKLEGNFIVTMQEDFYEEKNSAKRHNNAQKVLIEAKNNPLINADEATIEWLISMNKDPNRFYIKRDEAPQQPPNAPQQPPNAPPTIEGM